MKKTLFTKVILAISILIFSLRSHAQPGNLNISFGDNGIVKQTFYDSLNAFNEAAIGAIKLQNGFTIVGISVDTKTMLTRITSDGNIDLSYGINGYSQYVTMVGVRMTLGGDNKIYVAGSLPGRYIQLVRFNLDGSLDKQFGNNGIASIELINVGINGQSLAIQNDGKIVIGTHKFTTGSNADLVVVRFNTDGSIDNAFGNNGLVTTDFGFNDLCAATAIQADGKILLSGGITSNGLNNMSLVRYTSDGQLDLSFGNGGKVIFSQNISQGSRSLLVQPDGKIIIGGGNLDFTLVRYNSDGTHDQSFANNGVCTTNISFSETVQAMQLLDDGRIIVAGDVRFSQGTAIGLAQYTANGFPDQSFAGTGYVYYNHSTFKTANASSILVDSLGNIMLAGAVLVTNRQKDYALLQLESNGKIDSSFGFKTWFIKGETTTFRSILVQPDQKIIVAGLSGGADDSNCALARYNMDGSIDNSFGTNGKVINNLAGFDMINAAKLLPDEKIIAAGTATNLNGDLLIIKYNSNGSIDSSFGNQGRVMTDFGLNDVCAAIAIQEDGKILAAGYSLLQLPSAGNRFLLVRYLPNGVVDSSFALNGSIIGNFGYAQANLTDIQITPNGKILVLATALTTNGTSTTIVLAQYNSDGSIDNSFGNAGIIKSNVNTFDNSSAIKSLANGQILVSGSTGPTSSNRDILLLRYNADGSTDTSFGSNGKVVTDFGGQETGGKLAIQESGSIIVTGTRSIDTKNTIYITRYLPDGTLDLSFGTNGKVITDVADAHTIGDVVIAGKNLYVAGSLVYLSSYGAVLSYILDAPVTLSCPSNIITVTSNTECNATVNNIDPILTPQGAQPNVKYTLSGATTGNGNGTASGLIFNKGTTTVTYFLEEDTTKNCSFTVLVNDSLPPVIESPAVNKKVLWPVNLKMVDVIVNYNLSDNCGVDSTAIAVSSDEQDGNPSMDWEIVNEHLVRLRAKRDATSDGRIYTITVSAFDEAGNVRKDSITVSVPLSIGYNEEQNLRIADLDRMNTAGNAYIKVYPNPTNNQFVLTFIGLDQNKPASLRIFNLTGQQLGNWNNVQTKTIKIGESFKPGIYFVELTQGNQTTMAKIIKQ